MEISALHLAALVIGKIDGDPNININTFSKIEEAKAGSLTFIANPKYAHYIHSTEASVVLVKSDFQTEGPVKPTLVKVDDPYTVLATLLNMVSAAKPKKSGVEKLAYVADGVNIPASTYVAGFAYISNGATIGENVQIFPHCFVGENVHIGNNVILHSGVKIYNDCVIGENCIIHSGAVIGSDGFGFAPHNGIYTKIAQIGNVVIEDNVEIGANTCVDRSTMGSTVVHKGVKLDNLVQVAHNCEVGENTVMSAQVGIAGSTKIGAWCMLGGQVGIAGHISIGDKTFLGAQSGVPGNIKGDQTLIGTPPMEPKAYFKSQAIFRRLPDIYKQLNELQKTVEELKNLK